MGGEGGWELEGGEDGAVAEDGVFGGGNGGDNVVEVRRAFAGVGATEEEGWACGAGEESAAEEALEVDGEGGTEVAEGGEPEEEEEWAEGAAEAVAGKGEELVEEGVVVKEGCPAGVDEPGDAGGGISGAEPDEAGEGVDDVAEGSGFDEEDGGGCVG